jgi:hypothetical protein
MTTVFHLSSVNFAFQKIPFSPSYQGFGISRFQGFRVSTFIGICMYYEFQESRFQGFGVVRFIASEFVRFNDFKV